MVSVLQDESVWRSVLEIADRWLRRYSTGPSTPPEATPPRKNRVHWSPSESSDMSKLTEGYHYLSSELITFSRCWCRLSVDTLYDFLIGPELPSGHLTYAEYTNTIGRCALSVLDTREFTSTFIPILNEKTQVSLQNGLSGFDSKEWTSLLDPNDASVFESRGRNHLATMLVGSAMVVKRRSEDGEEGFPDWRLMEVSAGLIQPSGP